MIHTTVSPITPQEAKTPAEWALRMLGHEALLAYVAHLEQRITALEQRLGVEPPPGPFDGSLSDGA